jgi:hypothetical protein
VTSFLAGIGVEMAAVRAGNPRGPASDNDPNHTAIALVLNVADRQVLLGADLEETRSKGWSTIMARSTVERDKVELFKIPHHGSSNAHFGPLWNEDIPKDCWAVLTPFSSGSNPPPTEADVRRILSHTTRAYSAARASSTAAVKNHQAIEKLIAAGGIKNRHRREPKMGHVRFRANTAAGSPWSLERFGNAVLLKDIFS